MPHRSSADYLTNKQKISISEQIVRLTSITVKMHIPQPDDNSQKPYDEVINLIVDYAYDYEVASEAAWLRSKMALIDSLGVAIESLVKSKECESLIKPLLPGATNVTGGFRLPGTSYSLDVLQGAFNMGAMIRYLDHNDAFPGAEWGHPSGKSYNWTMPSWHNLDLYMYKKQRTLTGIGRQPRGYSGYRRRLDKRCAGTGEAR